MLREQFRSSPQRPIERKPEMKRVPNGIRVVAMSLAILAILLRACEGIRELA